MCINLYVFRQHSFFFPEYPLVHFHVPPGVHVTLVEKRCPNIFMYIWGNIPYATKYSTFSNDVVLHVVNTKSFNLWNSGSVFRCGERAAKKLTSLINRVSPSSSGVEQISDFLFRYITWSR